MDLLPVTPWREKFYRERRSRWITFGIGALLYTTATTIVDIKLFGGGGAISDGRMNTRILFWIMFLAPVVLFTPPILSWVDKAQNFFCPACQSHVASDTPWLCPYCRAEAPTPTPATGFLSACRQCKREPEAYKCHSCGEVIKLKESINPTHLATRLLPPLPGESAEDARVRRQREREDEEHQLEQLARKKRLLEAKAELTQTEQRLEPRVARVLSVEEEVKEKFESIKGRLMKGLLTKTAVLEMVNGLKKDLHEKEGLNDDDRVFLESYLTTAADSLLRETR